MKKSRIFLILAGLVTIFIFSNSLQNASTSSQMSSGLLSSLLNIFPFLQPVLSSGILRKAAHFAEFFLQGTFLSLSGVYSASGFRGSIWKIAFTGLFTACCDELLQTFSVGRSPEVTDVFIDFSGTALAMAIIAAAVVWREKKC